MFRWSLFAALPLAAALAGCGEDDGPTKPATPTPPQYLVGSSPQNALENLRRAYEARDSTQTDSVYHAAYQGESTDLSDLPGTPPLTFIKSDEVSHVASLRRSNEVLNAILDMGDPSTWIREDSKDVSHPEWASITLAQHIRLEIQTISDLYSVGSDDFFEYHFAPTSAPSSPTDTIWTVIRWREVKGAGGP